MRHCGKLSMMPLQMKDPHKTISNLKRRGLLLFGQVFFLVIICMTLDVNSDINS